MLKEDDCMCISGVVIDLPQRERRATFNVDEYFRGALRQGDKSVAGGRKRKVNTV